MAKGGQGPQALFSLKKLMAQSFKVWALESVRALHGGCLLCDSSQGTYNFSEPLVSFCVK